ncbi:MAG TPA: hypothetical protein VGI91_01545 [Steroidobacteraceae bacterium]|jgi:hypothetical protein
MPIHEKDPWRAQYFDGVPCPRQVHIPTDDALAYELYPAHRWVYNKLLVAESQGLACGAGATVPAQFPVFSKPITNLRGMGVGSRLVRSLAEFRSAGGEENFWSVYLTGSHVSTDWAIVAGEPVWCRHARGIPAAGGTFDYWVIEAGRREPMEYYCRRWIRAHLRGYTGMLNLETIGGRIIEVHLRFADQWPDLYGGRWIESLVTLYGRGSWSFADRERRDGYSVVLFGPHGVRYRYPHARLLQRYREVGGVTSVQVTFFQHLPPAAHAMPPGGFRLAVINCTRLSAGLALRARMAADFGLGMRRDHVRPPWA